jgi:hypothetical protein
LADPTHPRGGCTGDSIATNAPAAATGTILALDLGQYKSVAGLEDRATIQARLQSAESTRDQRRRPLAPNWPTLVIGEACTLAGRVHESCAESHPPCQVTRKATEA